MNKHLIMYWRIWNSWGPANLLMSYVAETEAILPYLMDAYKG
jgi:hypothetical protein